MLHSGCDSHWSSEPPLTSDLVLLNPMDVFAVLVLPDLCSILVVDYETLASIGSWLLLQSHLLVSPMTEFRKTG